MLFTGEMVFPWMFEDFAYLRPYKQTADLVAACHGWPRRPDLYDLQASALHKTTGGGSGPPAHLKPPCLPVYLC